MVFTFPKFTFNIDVEKTKAYYNIAKSISTDCPCCGCRNYEKAIDSLSKEIVSFFSQFGIEMKKVREVYVNCANADDTLYYGGFYHVCGEIVDGESALVLINSNNTAKRWDDEKAMSITDDFKVSFNNDCYLLADDFPLPAIQLEIMADIPWVLAEEHNYPKCMDRRK